MKTTKILTTLIILFLSTLTSMANHEKTTLAFIEAFKSADTAEMSKHFAEKVEFIGDHKFLGMDERLTKPMEIDKALLTKSYASLYELYGKDNWKKLAVKVKPSVTVSEEGKELRGLVKKGDVICDMNFREAKKGKRNGFDEAVIFVFRKDGDSYKVVFHLADY